jgi:hypothetical protein
MKKLFAPLIAVFFPLGVSAQFVINEFLADPATDISGDANGDGARDSSQDEFIEFVNNSGGPIDVDGWSITDSVSERHRFLGTTIVGDGQALVVFGGGTPTGTFGGAVVTTASTGLVGLNNGGDTITLFDASSAVIATVTYGGEGGGDEALTLDPDITGAVFVGHGSLGDGSLKFSPGTRNTGAPFAGDSLSVSITPASFSEGAGASAATGTVTRTGSTAAPSIVTLLSSDTGEVAVPATVTIAAGFDSATFQVDAVDDEIQDADQSVVITASAADLFSGSFQVTVEDDEAPIPTIVLTADPDTISENGGSSTVTIEVSAGSVDGYTFDLSSDDTGELTVPATVSIAPNATTATFTATAVDDAVVDGTQSVLVTASDPDLVILSTNVSLSVTDDESFELPTILVNEVRVDDPSTDDDEYIELYSPDSDFSLGRLFVIVIGDGAGGGSGVVERVLDLNGLAATGNYFLIGSSRMTLATPDLVVSPDFLENSDNISIILVSDFTGASGDDLDPNDDGVLDFEPWGDLLDGVSLIEEPNGDDSMGGFTAPNNTEWDYSMSLGVQGIGPDENGFVPGHVFRNAENEGEFSIGVFDPSDEAANDTPGAENTGGVTPTDDDEIVITNITVNTTTGQVVLTVSGLGNGIYDVQSSTDLDQADAWANVTGSVLESDNGDDVDFTFIEVEFAVSSAQFYRILKQ